MERPSTTTVALQIEKVKKELKKLIKAYKNQEEKLTVISRKSHPTKKILKNVRAFRKHFEHELNVNLIKAQNFNTGIDLYFVRAEKEAKEKKKELEKKHEKLEKLAKLFKRI